MRKIYEDQGIIVINTENYHISNPIVIFYGKEEQRTNFEIDNFNFNCNLAEPKIKEIIKSIIIDGRNSGYYDMILSDIKEKIDYVTNKIKELSIKNDVEYFEEIRMWENQADKLETRQKKLNWLMNERIDIVLWYMN